MKSFETQNKEVTMKKKILLLITSCVLAGVTYCIYASPRTPVKPSDGMTYVEQEILYVLPETGSQRKFIDHVTRIVERRNDTMSLLALGQPTVGDSSVYGSLLLVNDSGVQILAEHSSGGSISPDGKSVVIVNEPEKSLSIVTIDGQTSATIPVEGGNPLWSPDGRYIVFSHYGQMPCVSEDQLMADDFCNLGLAMFDIKTGQVTQLTENGNDDAVIAFSSNGNRVIFEATRPYDDDMSNHIASMWSVDIHSKKATRLTNASSTEVSSGRIVPYISSDSVIWTSNKEIAFSSNGQETGLWKYQFSPSGDLIKAEHIADGDSPYWVVQDKELATRVVQNGRNTRYVLTVQ
jgi:Tol biopolymer transport system component